MYKVFKFRIVFLLFFVISSCSDFLSVEPQTKTSENQYFKTQDEFIESTNGCYVPLRNYYRTFWVLAEMKSDNSSFQNNTTTGSASRGWDPNEEFRASPNYSIFSNFWENSYDGITRCNKLLTRLEGAEIDWVDKSYKKRCKGEALFLRALYYFNLVREFGAVPLVKQPITSEEAVNLKRVAVDTVYNFIIKDLKESSTSLKDAEEVEENGRASWGAATSLLGEVYLTLHNYKEAKTQFETVINSGKYSLLSNYANLFDPSNKDYEETIFSIQYSEDRKNTSEKFIFQFAPWTSGGDVTKRPNISIKTSGGWNQPTEDLINAFTPGDKRKDVAIGFWKGKDWDGEVRAIPYCAKYKPPISSSQAQASNNFPVIRYAGILLKYAEVLNQMGSIGEAASYVEKVRQRAGLTDAISINNQETLDSLIGKEEQKELCFENHRWYYLKRTGKAISVMTEHGKREKELKSYIPDKAFQIDSFKLLDPIPSREVLINKLKQNPGY